MSQLHRASVAPAAGAERAPVAIAADLLELAKPRITRMVVVTAMVGFALAALGRSFEMGALWVRLVGCVVGVALSSAGANALNQWLERERDRRMTRTADRPIPAGRLSPATGLAFGLGAATLGVIALWTLSSAAAAVVSLATVLLYVLVYTPMKPVSPSATIVGAVPGALPPVIGWAAAFPSAQAWDSLLVFGGWSLFLLMFVWQIPHFLGIAWMHRADYERGGHRVLPVVEASGRRTAATMLLWSVALAPASLVPVRAAAAIEGPFAWAYVVIALAASLVFIAAAVGFCVERTTARARLVFIISIMHLPLVLVALVAGAALARAVS